MKTDLTTKVLLTLILVALCVLLFRQEVTSVLTQARVMPSDNAAIAYLGPGGTMAYVVSGGRISFWEVDTDQGKAKLVMYDSKPLPK